MLKSHNWLGPSLVHSGSIRGCGPLGLRRQLENRCALARRECRHHHNGAIRKFKRIVMNVFDIDIDLSKPRDEAGRLFRAKKETPRTLRAGVFIFTPWNCEDDACIEDPNRSLIVTDYARQPMSKPERVVLAFTMVAVCVLMVTMMTRALNFQAQVNAPAETQEFEEARIPLPAGPRKFQ